MIILGLNAYHGNASASIVVDGKLIAAVEEERFNRVKGWAGLPIEVVIYCFDEADFDIFAVEHIAINRDPKANILKKALFSFAKRPSFKLVVCRLKNASRLGDIRTDKGLK